MSNKMNVSGSYGTHLGALIACMSKTDGDVLELGMGIFSTPYLHYQCLLSKRHLTSVENSKSWANWFLKYKYPNNFHNILIVKDWSEAPTDKFWDVVLIDQTPDEERIKSVKKLANNARYIIIHDSNEKHEHIYHFSEIYPLFKYSKVWTLDDRHATVLSNFVNLDNLW